MSDTRARARSRMREARVTIPAYWCMNLSSSSITSSPHALVLVEFGMEVIDLSFYTQEFEVVVGQLIRSGSASKRSGYDSRPE